MFSVWTVSLSQLSGGRTAPRRARPLPLAVTPVLQPANPDGMESGSLARGLREAVDSRAVQLPVYRALVSRLAYLGWVAFGMTSIVGS